VAEGLDVLLLDAAPLPGGQIWRARQGVAAPPVARMLARFAPGSVRVLAGTRVVMALPGRALLIDGPDGARRVRWNNLILATGARERLLPFPGWTLPGVFGAGGLQALVKGGWPIRGKRVLVAGTGPLLLAAAATLRREGAQVVGLAEEAGQAALARFAGTLVAHPRKALQAARLGALLLGVPFLAGRRIVAAEGDGRVERVLLQGADGRTRRQRYGGDKGQTAQMRCFIEMIEKYRHHEAIMIVGHNPSETNFLARTISPSGKVRVDFKKGAVAKVVAESQGAQLHWMLTPKVARTLYETSADKVRPKTKRK